MRVKMKLVNVSQSESGDKLEFRPTPVGAAENEAVFASSPVGCLNLEVITRGSLTDAIPGNEFYVDFSLAPATVIPPVE